MTVKEQGNRTWSTDVRWCACPVPEEVQIVTAKGSPFSGDLMVFVCFLGYLKLMGFSALNISLSWLIYFDVTAFP